jgi:hypothetical protein
MTLTGVLNYINTSIKSSVKSAVESLIKNTYKVKFPEIQKIEGKVKVDFPNIQKIEGIVKTDTAQGFNSIVKKIEETKQLFGQKGIQVNNFPKIPTKIEVTNFPQEKEIDFKSLESKLDSLNESIKKLPTKFPEFPKIPEVKIPAFPKIPEVKIPEFKFPKSFKVDNIENLKSDDPEDYVPVRLTDGKEFYKAIEEFYQAVTSSQIFALSNGQKDFGLVDEDHHVQVDVLTAPTVDTSLLATKAKQDDMIEAIENIELDTSTLATESTLEAIKDKVTEDVAQTLTYNADGTIATMVKVVGGVTYTKTFSYTSGNVTGISAWVAS